MATALKSIKPVIAEDDGVREVHGLAYDGDSSVHLCEHGDRIVLKRSAYDRRLTPKSARYVASKLYRLARRIERRELVK